MDSIYIILLIAIVGLFIIRKIFQNKFGWIKPSDPFSTEWRTILIKNVAYYNSLSNDEKSLFEYKVQEFLLNCRITGIGCYVHSYHNPVGIRLESDFIVSITI